MTADGFSLDDKRSPVADNDIPDIIQRFKNLDKESDRKRTDKSFMVPKKEIVDLQFNKVNASNDSISDSLRFFCEKPNALA